MEHAEATFVLKVNKNCQACKMKMMVALGSICGIYDVDYNSEEGLARVHAVVEPNMLLKALAGTGPHAECKGLKLRHPKMNPNYYIDDNYDTHNYRNGYSYGAIDDPYSYRRALPDSVGHPSYHYSSTSPYYHGSNPYYYGSDIAPARYVPSYPPNEYDPYGGEPISICSIM